MKSNGNPSQSPQSESPEVLNSFAKVPVEEFLASGSAPMWMVPSHGSSMLEEEQSPPPPNQLLVSQKNKMELASQSFSLVPNEEASEDVSKSDEHEASTGIDSSCGSSEDDTSTLVANSILKKVRHVSGVESETSPRGGGGGGGGSRRGVMSAPRLSLTSYSMPSLLSISENYDSAFLVNESVASFVEFGNDSTVSFLDSSSRTNHSCLDTSSRTSSSSHVRGSAPSYSSMPSLRSIEDNEDSQMLVYDASRTFGNSSSTESAFNSFQHNNNGMMLPIMVDSIKPGFGGIKVSYEGQGFAAESVTKDIISPPSISQHLHFKNLEKRLLRWDAVTSSATLGGPPTAGNLRPSLNRTTATTSITASLKNDPTSVDARNSGLDSRQPQGANNAAQARVASGNDKILTLRSGSCDTLPAMARRRPSVTADPSDSFSSQEETDTTY